MNRGVDRAATFRRAADGSGFLSLVGRHAVKSGVEVHAYCLMPNHFHLLLHCPHGELSTMMQRVGSHYTRQFNERHERDGPLFRGRFFSKAIEDDHYLDTVGRYIHRNPLALGPTTDAVQYRWSSLGAYAGVVPTPHWLTTRTLIERAGLSRRTMVEQTVGDLESPAHQRAWSWAIDLAIAECFDTPVQRVGRTIEALIAAEDGAVAVSNRDRVKRQRARQRAGNDPRIAQAANRARTIMRQCV